MRSRECLMRRPTYAAAFLALTTAMGCVHAPVAGQPPRPAVPVPAADAIFEAARSHPIVALSEGEHSNEAGYRFRLSLLRDPRFAKTFNDIVVESGSSRYQDLMDRFIAGEDVPQELIRQAWENSTQVSELWDMPIYEGFFRAVRDRNASLPPSRRLRVILGDPPIDWDTVKDKDDVLRFNDMRDRFAADTIRTQILAKKRRGLLVFGDGHIWRKGPHARPDIASEKNIVSFLAETSPGVVFSIGAPTAANLKDIQADTASWPTPSIARLQGTILGAAPFAPLYRTPYQDTRDASWDALRLQDQFDALLYLGPAETITHSSITPAKCADSRYMTMRLARMALVPWGTYAIERLKRVCGTS